MKSSTIFILCLLLCAILVTVDSSLPDFWHLKSPFPKDYDDMPEGRPHHIRILRPMRIIYE